MQFGQIIKDILNKDNAVWIPNFGLLRYEDGSSKLIIDQSGSGSEVPLLSLIAQRNNLNPTEAATMMNNAISVMKSALRSQGKYTIDGIGDIIEFNNTYQVLESKKNIFPSDFFGMSNFDFNQNKTATDFYSEAEKQPFEETARIDFNTPPPTPVEVQKVEIETPKSEPVSIITPPVEPITTSFDEMKSEMDGFIEETLLKEEEPQERKSESLFDSFMIKIKGTSKPKKEEPLAEEESNLFSTTDSEASSTNIEQGVESIISINVQDNTPEDHHVVQETVIEPILEYDGINRLKEEIEEKNEEDDEEEDLEDEIDEYIDEDNEEYIDEPVQQSKPSQSYIDPSTLSRRNIGKATYDQGYYEHLVNKRVTSASSIRWNLILPIVSLSIAVAFFIPWLVASSQGKSFLGMAPLWDSVKKEEKKIVQAAPTAIDTTKVDSAAMAMTTAKDTSSKLATASTTIPATTTTAVPPKTENNIAISTSPKVDKKSGIASNTSITTKENTPPKTSAVELSTVKKQKTSSATASVIAKTQDSTQKTREVASSSKTPKTMANVVGKPYATANYTKGNHYLSFGQFKLPKHASKLKKDLNRLGVETDVVLVDGTYRVVIPYTNKDKAVSAAKDYPNTSVFE